MKILADIEKIRKDKFILDNYYYIEDENDIFIDTYQTDYSMAILINKETSVLTLEVVIDDCNFLHNDIIRLIHHMYDNKEIEDLEEIIK